MTNKLNRLNLLFYSSDHLAYIPHVEFLQDESTNEHLIFKFKPMIDGEFPNGVRMLINATLRHFDPAPYYFDMTPGEFI